jgi:hypothetical protein
MSAMENLRSDVTNIRVPEVAADFLRPALGAPQEAPHVSYELLFVAGAFPSHGVCLDVLVQELVRAELGLYPGRKKRRICRPIGQVIHVEPGSGVRVKTGDSAILIEEIQFEGGIECRVPHFPIGTTVLSNWRAAYVELKQQYVGLEARLRRLEEVF